MCFDRGLQTTVMIRNNILLQPVLTCINCNYQQHLLQWVPGLPVLLWYTEIRCRQLQRTQLQKTSGTLWLGHHWVFSYMPQTQIRTYSQGYSHTATEHHETAMVCRKLTPRKKEYTNRLNRFIPYLSLFRGLKTQLDCFVSLAVLQIRLPSTAEAVHKSEKGSHTRCTYTSATQ